jgi:hypothetical protein
VPRQCIVGVHHNFLSSSKDPYNRQTWTRQTCAITCEQNTDTKRSITQGDSEWKVNILGGDSVGHCEEKVHMNMWLILNYYPDRAVWISKNNAVRYLFVALDEERSLNRKINAWNESLARILDAAARIKKRGDQLRLTTCDLRTPVAKCIEVDGGIFENLLWTVTNVSFLGNKFVI